MRTRNRLWLALLVIAIVGSACSHHDDTVAPPPPVDPGFDSTSDGVSLQQILIDCPPGGDCVGFVQVLFKGEIRANPLNQPSAVTAIDTLGAGELNQVRSLALDAAMIEIFKQGDAGCASASDTVEVMRLLDANDEFSVKITGCTSGTISSRSPPSIFPACDPARDGAVNAAS